MIVLSVFYYGGIMMTESQITVGELTSFLLYAAYVGISIAGESMTAGPDEVGGGGALGAQAPPPQATKKKGGEKKRCITGNILAQVVPDCSSLLPWIKHFFRGGHATGPP